MGTKLQPGRFDCYANAAPDEPIFVLLGREHPANGYTDEVWAMGLYPNGERAPLRTVTADGTEIREWTEVDALPMLEHEAIELRRRLRIVEANIDRCKQADTRPRCPSETCPYCTNDACGICGPNRPDNCLYGEHDVLDRHSGTYFVPPLPAEAEP